MQILRIIMLILGGIVIVIQICFTLSQRIGCTKEVEAKMIDLVKHVAGIGSVKLPVLRYTVNGKQYTVEARIHAKGWKKEGTHHIYVNPKNPEQIWHRSNWTDCIKVVFIGLLCIGLSLINF